MSFRKNGQPLTRKFAIGGISEIVGAVGNTVKDIRQCWEVTVRHPIASLQQNRKPGLLEVPIGRQRFT
jgi:hypothetical protein